MSSTNDDWQASEADQQALLAVAEESIRYSLQTGQTMEPDLSLYSEDLRRHRASFVTLRIDQQLRGCIGSIKVTQSLVADVCKNAYAAAFCDPRLPPLRTEELPFVCIHVSVLSPTRQIPVKTLAEAIAQVRAGTDGVLIRLGRHVATFLPDVWEALPEPTEFFQHLRRKAGLDPNAWSETMEVFTYTTQHFSRDAPEQMPSAE